MTSCFVLKKQLLTPPLLLKLLPGPKDQQFHHEAQELIKCRTDGGNEDGNSAKKKDE